VSGVQCSQNGLGLQCLMALLKREVPFLTWAILYYQALRIFLKIAVLFYFYGQRPSAWNFGSPLIEQ
jgi:hypothetical protein